jgi:hypothetical protein
MPKRQSRPRKPKLLIDELTPSLEERCLAQLRQGLPPDADEFDRVCFEARANYVNLEAELRAPATANDKRKSR